MNEINELSSWKIGAKLIFHSLKHSKSQRLEDHYVVGAANAGKSSFLNRMTLRKRRGVGRVLSEDLLCDRNVWSVRPKYPKMDGETLPIPLFINRCM